MLNYNTAKITACLLALLVLLAGCASTKTTFSFRDVQWGITLDQAAKLEAGQEDSSPDQQNEDSAAFFITAYGYDCTLNYICTDSEAVDIILLEFYSPSPEQISDIYRQLLQDYPPKEDLLTQEQKDEGVLFYKAEGATILASSSATLLFITFSQP